MMYVKGGDMLLENILKEYSDFETNNSYIRYPISEKVESYIKHIDVEPFYVSPMFTDIKINKSTSTQAPKFILFSAAGAVGKSALAKFISYTYNALYWDLSKMTLGTASFIGAISKAVGDKNYSTFISDLNQAKTLLVIDAFDEAEMISGRDMIGEFLHDINESMADECPRASVFLFARSETAQYIVDFCADNHIHIKHYEIG